uniref:Glycosyltransferase 2-like domain-containing protein n=1 Tax=viral metagenome TaxID=1070528 RepID=A0A6C0B530_9ZZZZ
MNSIALCFCVKNCGKYLNNIFSNIELLKKNQGYKVYCIFVYDNCEDNSKNLLENYQEKNTDSVIIKNIENNSTLRTVRIAKARNTCLDIVYNELNNITFHLMIDCDDACSSKWDVGVINNYLNNFDNDDWDCISFNRHIYYDIWALLFDDFKHHCWGFGYNSEKVMNIMYGNITMKLKNSKTNSMEVISAFNGFAIYRTERFKGLYYDGLYSNVKKLITDDERISTLNLFKEKYNLNLDLDENYTQSWRERDSCCEHIFYHLSAKKKGCKVKISKFKVIQ